MSKKSMPLQDVEVNRDMSGQSNRPMNSGNHDTLYECLVAENAHKVDRELAWEFALPAT